MTKRAIVVIPSTGAPELRAAVTSVLWQTHANTECLVVTDGAKFKTDVSDALADIQSDRLHRLDLPFNTGANGFYGHRIMAAISHLVDHDYVLFLDQDNWYAADHVDSLVTLCSENNLDWAHSLRKITDKDGKFLCCDDCESLGKWPIASSPSHHLIDTSTYCFGLPFLRNVGHLWNYGWGADRRFYALVTNEISSSYDCTGKYTLNYRLGGNEGSVTEAFFTQGNAISRERYGSVFPWATIGLDAS